MDLLWLYDLETWQFAAIVIASALSIGLAGLVLTRRYVERLHQGKSHNDIVSFYLASVGVFYGITLGLIAVGTWENYTVTETKAALEASSLAALYRDVSLYPEPERGTLQGDLKKYTRYVIDDAWPQQRKGIIPKGGTLLINVFQGHLGQYEPKTEGQKILHAEALRQFNNLIELRRMRILSTTTGLPESVWWIVVLGAFVNIFITWFFHMESFKVHVWMTVSLSVLLGLLIYLMGAMDRPFRGKVSVGPEAFESVYEQLMKE
jgi:hypothetical protein